jgi:hypothetical protein
MMRLLAPYAIGAFTFAAILAFVVNWFVQDDRDRHELQDAKDHISTRERIDDATTPVDGCAWFDRLRGACE